MQTTGIFKIHVEEVSMMHLQTLVFKPFGDVHFGAPHHAADVFDNYLDECKQIQEEGQPVRYLGMGDYMDIASASERRILHHKDLHDSTRASLDDFARAVTEDFASKLEFMGSNLIGLIEGNHYYEFMDGTTSTQYLCQLLKCPYLGVSCFIRTAIMIGRKESKKRTSFDIWAHHGRGGARLVGGSLNRVQQMAEVAHADIYLMGHDHRRGASPHPILYLNRKNRLCEKRQFFVRTGSFLKAYEHGKVSYIADLALGACDLGAVALLITPKRRETQGYKTEIRAIV